MPAPRFFNPHVPTIRGLGLLLTLLFSIAGHGEVFGDQGSPGTVSIWDREVPGTTQTYADVSRSNVSEENTDPVLFPLPAPLVAAGLGLMGAYLLKRRHSRI